MVALFLAYIILLIPVMGFFEHPHFHVDRYSLISSVCLSLLIAYGIIHIKREYFQKLIVSLILVIGVLGWLTVNQIKVWNNSESLFTHMIATLENDPYQQDIYWRLGKYQYENGKIGSAIINFEKTLAFNPYHQASNRFLAIIEYENGNLIKVIHHLKNLLKENPDDIDVHLLLSQMFTKLNKEKEASYHMDRANISRQ